MRNGRAGFLIHTGGTGILVYKDMDRKTFGEASTEVFDDWDGIDTITSLPDFALHRTVDKIVLAANCSSLKTAIVCPPTIYGVGRGPGNQRGHQLYELARCTLEKKHGLMVGSGETFWPNVHVHDMSKCYLKLVAAAADGGVGAKWGHEGYYFTENGEHVWGKVAQEVASAAKRQGLITVDHVKSISAVEADQMTPFGSILWGANSRCRAVRARKILGWSPKEGSFHDEISNAVLTEARLLGLASGHAGKVAGC